MSDEVLVFTGPSVENLLSSSTRFILVLNYISIKLETTFDPRAYANIPRQ
jgi:hypothetical protein